MIDFAWVIEMPSKFTGGNPRYWCGPHAGDFSQNPNCAIRFARQVDAERVARYNGYLGIAVEHGWD